VVRRGHLRLTGDDERLRDERSDDPGLAGPRDIDALERRIIPDVVRGVAMCDLPQDFTLVEADR
jgi:hypothetical protein